MKMYQLGYIYQLDRDFDFWSSYPARKNQSQQSPCLRLSCLWISISAPSPLPSNRDSCFYWCCNIAGTCYSISRLQVNGAGVVERLERMTLQLASCLDTIDILGKPVISSLYISHIDGGNSALFSWKHFLLFLPPIWPPCKPKLMGKSTKHMNKHNTLSI